MEDDYETPLRIAAKRHDMIAVAVTDPREESLPDVGLVSVVDAETGRETLIDTSDRHVRDEYAALARRRAERRDEILKRTKVDAIRVRTDEPYVQELFRFFRMRERRLS